MSKQRFILVSFDVEEFDMPLEYQHQIAPAEQMDVGYRGLQTTMDIVNGNPAVKGTFFTTANFAAQYPAAVEEISHTHEIASHTYYHTDFSIEHLQQSREKLEAITQKPVYGLRMPRMRAVDMQDVINAGYRYDSSINPTWVPGRYDNRDKPRTIYDDNGMLRLPASVTPRLRIPLFWLLFKNTPYTVFKQLVLQTLNNDGYVCLYFHPWEFVDITGYGLPGYTRRWCGEVLCHRLNRLLKDLAAHGDFIPIHTMLQLRQYLP